MHTLQSAKELLYSLPIEVVFAGFKSDTYTLGRCGWDLSIMERDYPNYGCREFQLAMRHGDQKHALYCMSSPWRIENIELYRYLSDKERYYEFFVNHRFEIMYASNDITFRTLTVPRREAQNFSSSFRAFDSQPQERWEEESIKDFKFFKTCDEQTQELIITPERVPEILDLILKAQSETQAQIKSRMKSRENLQRFRNGEVFDGKPARRVEAQLITLVG